METALEMEPTAVRDNACLALKASCLDEEKTPHLLIGLSSENIETLLKGEVLVLPHGKNLPLTDKNDIAVMFGETNE